MANLTNYLVGKMESNIREAYERLTELYNKWYSTPRQRSQIEDLIYTIIENPYYVPHDIYTEVTDGGASGLCQPGFFERDMQKLLSILKKRLDNTAQ
ncbi:MAG: hypothetical protein K2H59_07075 [Muribaculaceae bacterium]|nr:hypothetical protein [Muribaculaceae bacterium]